MTGLSGLGYKSGRFKWFLKQRSMIMIDMNMLAAAGDYFNWKIQLPLLLVLIAIIVFWLWYRKRQM